MSPPLTYGFCLAELCKSQCGEVSSWFFPFPSLWEQQFLLCRPLLCFSDGKVAERVCAPQLFCRALPSLCLWGASKPLNHLASVSSEC